MRKVFFVIEVIIFSFLSAQNENINIKSFDSSLRITAEKLLTEWMDTFISYQITHNNKALDGGVLCPSCARIHGRIGDAILPLMYLAEKTGEKKYLDGGKRLMAWMENVHRFDGSWMNDINVSDWNGTTVFASIALYEALRFHGHLLDDSTRNHWKNRLIEAGNFIINNPFIYSRNRKGMRNMNINYSASATYALFAIGDFCNISKFKDEAAVIADGVKKYFTDENFFLFGEGPNIKSETKNGCRPIDLLYNVEESLPNLAYYAIMANDSELLSLVENSMKTHLEFMLPDGAWDNSWGTRSFKWTYWGGRTSDGFMGGYYKLALSNPVFLEAIHRNIKLLTEATHDGLLHGGMNYKSCGVTPCIHHTFGHAKALTSFLEQKPLIVDSLKKLPRDYEYGFKFFKEIRTWLVSQGEWRATITGNDSEYKVKGTHPMGGALSLLWHSKIGPIFAATMNQYNMIEAPNMQSNTRKYLVGGTPRIEFIHDNISYSNLDDLDTDIKVIEGNDFCFFKVNTHLVDINQNSPLNKQIPIKINYEFSKDRVNIIVERCHKSAYLILPIIASSDDKVIIDDNKIHIKKQRGNLILECESGIINILPTDNDGRIFNPVPGFSFIPIQILPNEVDKKIIASLYYNN